MLVASSVITCRDPLSQRLIERRINSNKDVGGCKYTINGLIIFTGLKSIENDGSHNNRNGHLFSVVNVCKRLK